jgi:ABC-type nitrate/sulfonate/bicarbonate transport system substrate-binding protein
MRLLSRPLFVALVVLAVAPAAVLAACGGSESPSPAASPDKVSLQLNWFHEAEFVGYYVAEAKGFYGANDIEVTILEGGPGDPAIDHVLDGRSDFAISSFGEQRDAVAEDLPTVALMSAFQIPPLVIFSLAESGIASPADLAGRRVGVTTDYWKDVLDQTLKAAGVKPSLVVAVPAEAGDLQALYDGTVDAWLGYAQDEPIRAELAGHAVRSIFPADYGVGGYEGLLLADRETVEGDPDLVRRFVRASQQGWRYAVEHPDEAARILLDWAPEPGLEFQKLAVRAVGPLVDAPQATIGWIDAERWRLLMGDDFDPARPGFTALFSASAP